MRASNQSVLLASLSSFPPAFPARRTVFMAAMFIKASALIEAAHSWLHILFHIERINENISQGHDDSIVFLFVCACTCA